jgi:cytochrome P450
MATMFFYLSRYPSCRERLAKEIRSTFADSADIQGGPQLASCGYLRACIDETLRISPPVPGILWREIADDDDSDEPFIVDGHVVPPGTQVGVSSYSLHHDEAYFPEPFVFKPERWLTSDQADSEEQLAKKRMTSAFCAFSAGSRGCAGKAMAYLEISLVAARTLWSYDFDPAPGRVGEIGAGQKGKKGGRGRINEFQLYDIFASYHEGPFLVFRPRKHV